MASQTTKNLVYPIVFTHPGALLPKSLICSSRDISHFALKRDNVLLFSLRSGSEHNLLICRSQWFDTHRVILL